MTTLHINQTVDTAKKYLSFSQMIREGNLYVTSEQIGNFEMYQLVECDAFEESDAWHELFNIIMNPNDEVLNSDDENERWAYFGEPLRLTRDNFVNVLRNFSIYKAVK